MPRHMWRLYQRRSAASSGIEKRHEAGHAPRKARRRIVVLLVRNAARMAFKDRLAAAHLASASRGFWSESLITAIFILAMLSASRTIIYYHAVPTRSRQYWFWIYKRLTVTCRAIANDPRFRALWEANSLGRPLCDTSLSCSEKRGALRRKRSSLGETCLVEWR